MFRLVFAIVVATMEKSPKPLPNGPSFVERIAQAVRFRRAKPH